MLTVVPGFLGTYPNVFLTVNESAAGEASIDAPVEYGLFDFSRLENR